MSLQWTFVFCSVVDMIDMDMREICVICVL